MCIFLKLKLSESLKYLPSPTPSTRCKTSKKHDCSSVIKTAQFFAPSALRLPRLRRVLHRTQLSRPRLHHDRLPRHRHQGQSLQQHIGNNSSQSVRVVTCVPDIPAVTAGGKRGDTGKAPEGDGRHRPR